MVPLALPLLMVASSVLLMLRPTFSTEIPEPLGWRGESITRGLGTTLYTASYLTGAIFAIDASTNTGTIAVPPPPSPSGTTALGVKFDDRTNLLYSCVRAPSGGQLRVFDMAHNGTLLQTVNLTKLQTSINDLVITPTALFVTNSYKAEYYQVSLDPHGSGLLLQPAVVKTIPLSGAWVQVSGINANGIVSPDHGKTLIIDNTAGNKLYKVNASTGVASVINVDEEPLQGDALMWLPPLLYVVLHTNQIKVYELSNDFTTGTATCNLTNSNFHFPTSVAYLPETGNIYITSLQSNSSVQFIRKSNFNVTALPLARQCLCLRETGCDTCSLGLKCVNYGHWSRCLESLSHTAQECVETNNWGCGAAGGSCCNHEASCTSTGVCWLPCQYKRGY